MKINVSAPLNSLGYGNVGINVVAALSRLGHAPALWPIGGLDVPPGHHDAVREAMARCQKYDRKAPSLRIYHQFDLAQHVGVGLHCGFPIFELDTFTDVEFHHLRQQDRIFVCSRWAREVLAARYPEEQIFVAPLGVDTTIFNPDLPSPAQAGEAGGTIFLNVGKWEVRKGHDVLIDAFNKAFGPADDVRLVMCAYNPCIADPQKRDAYNAEWAKYYKESRLGDKVTLVPRLPTQKDVAQLMAACDVGVFPARAEGWNLELLEMMAVGKHVIATNYAAHTEFCDPSQNASLVDVHDVEPAFDGVWFHGQGNWAKLGDDQVDQLVERMRLFHTLKQQGNLGPNAAGVRTARRFSWENTASAITNSFN